MTHLYRLPERLQFAVKSNYFQYNSDPDKQLAVLKMWAELYPDDNLAHEVLVQVHWVRGEVDEALAAQDRLLELEPNNTDYLTQAATMQREQGNLEKARDYLESIIEITPDDPQALVSLGELMQVMGQHEEAKHSFEQALVFRPRNPNYRLALAGAEFQLGNIATAIELTETVLTDPLSPQELLTTQQALARIYERTGQIGRAIEILTTALAEGEGQVSPLELISVRGMLALLHASRGDQEGATQIITDLRSRLTHPLTILASIYALRVLVELEDYPGARLATAEIFTAIQEMKWEHVRPTLLRGMGEIHEGESHPDSALVYYDRWLSQEPTESRAMLRRGRCLRKLQKLDDAHEAISTALRRRPYDADFLFEAALLEHERGKTAAAIAHLERALEVWSAADPDYAPAQKARATLVEWQQGS
jgi:superkiller protein 3